MKVAYLKSSKTYKRQGGCFIKGHVVGNDTQQILFHTCILCISACTDNTNRTSQDSDLHVVHRPTPFVSRSCKVSLAKHSVSLLELQKHWSDTDHARACVCCALEPTFTLSSAASTTPAISTPGIWSLHRRQRPVERLWQARNVEEQPYLVVGRNRYGAIPKLIVKRVAAYTVHVNQDLTGFSLRYWVVWHELQDVGSAKLSVNNGSHCKRVELHVATTRLLPAVLPRGASRCASAGQLAWAYRNSNE